MSILEKVSVIVPVYNREKRLDICIGSLLAQTYKNLEIILINDGSTDSSPEIIEKYFKENPEIIKIINQKNKGVAAARNSGLAAATGDYLMFLDSDDFLHKDCIQEVLNHTKQKGADITRFKMTYKYTDGTEKVASGIFPCETLVEKKDFKKNVYVKMITGIKMNSICITLYKRNVVENIKFREDMVTAEDLIFNIEAFTKAQRYLYLPESYYYYFQSNEGLTGRGVSVYTKYKCNLIVSAVLLRYLKQWGMFSPLYKIMTVCRLLFITLSKIKRRFLKDV